MSKKNLKKKFFQFLILIYNLSMSKASPFAISLEKICQDRGLRLTEQRKVIVRLLEETISDKSFTQMLTRFLKELLK